jgi:hypothetical protein
MAGKRELEAIIARQTQALRSQMAELEALRVENQRLHDCIATNHDALAVLQRVYSDPASPVSVTLKAASEAINFERPRQPTANVNFDVSVLASRLAAARKGLQDPGDSGYDDAIEVENSTGQ